MSTKIIAGPCQHESFKHSSKIIDHLLRVTLNDPNVKHPYGTEIPEMFDLYFKASFDKANRTNMSSKRGLGLEQTLLDFKLLKEKYQGLKIVTDVHERDQIRAVSEVVDVLQIPAFLCRQTDLILEACDTDCIVNIKKGQFLSPHEIDGVVSKTSNAKEVWITERGTSFGYNTLVVDMRGLHIMKEAGHTVIFDGTHSCQAPGGLGKSSGGNRDHVMPLCKAAVAVGVDGLFMEVHDDPDNAPSDGPNMVTPDMYTEILFNIRKILRARI